jgi:hypothetical protein
MTMPSMSRKNETQIASTARWNLLSVWNWGNALSQSEVSRIGNDPPRFLAFASLSAVSDFRPTPLPCGGPPCASLDPTLPGTGSHRAQWLPLRVEGREDGNLPSKRLLSSSFVSVDIESDYAPNAAFHQ